MIKAIERLNHCHNPADLTVTLPFSLRQKSRFKCTADSGEEIGFFLDRGKVLRDGDMILSEDDRYIKIVAADEEVVTATSDNHLTLNQACYHLGNRHVPLQIAESWCRFQPDHVLQEMVESLGLSTSIEMAPFEPESGAYGEHSHHHHHD